MLDIHFIKENKEKIKEVIKNRFIEGTDVGKVLELDKSRRKLIQEVELLNSQRKEAADKKDIERGRELKERHRKKELELAKIEVEYREEMYKIPNIVLDDVPVGDEKANKVLKKVGEIPKFGFTPRDHVEIGKSLDMIDIPRATKVSGSRFYYLKNDAVLLELALTQYVMDTLVKEGFTPVLPPVLIKKQITDGLGYWQAGGNENFYLISDFEIGGSEKGEPLPLYLIGTGEHAVVPMHLDEVLEAGELPKRYIALSANFRREAGSYGKDTHGILRVHQFDKLEMVSFVEPRDGGKELEKLLSLAENFVRALELPYRLVQLASSELSFPAATTIDIETWIPSQNKYRETHSISTTTDFQSRRLNIKYKKGNSAKCVHILNATAIAMPRIIIAILENHQQKDGSIKLPKVLHEYLGKDTIQRHK
ncbi:MAG: serine--tRNA ligase [bacterium]|nr:serine--tRNA ligase [bacterium]